MDKQSKLWCVKVSILGAVLAFFTTGCGVMGVKEIDAWGFKTTFSEGLDFHIGANQIDHVDNRRGVSAGNSPSKSKSGKY